VSAPVRRFRDIDRVVGRVLVRVTYVAVALLTVGVALMIGMGISPLAGGPPLHPETIVNGITQLEPAAFLWLGLLAVIATPVSRVITAAAAFARDGERLMAAVSLAILIVIAFGVAASTIDLAS
jgi:uncharacterized membrane protein